jgi:hypothetical protein
VAFEGRKTAAASRRPGERPQRCAQPRGRRDTPRPWGAFHGSCVSRTQPGSKRLGVQQGSAATCEGWGGTLPPRGPPAHATSVRHERAPPVPLHAQCLRPRSASTDARLARPIALAGCQTVVAVLLVRAVHPVLAGGSSPDGGQHASGPPTRQSQAQPHPLWGPGLDAGALRQYIASLARREERQERDRWRPSSPAHCGTRTPSWGGSPRRLGRAASRSRQERQNRLP